jgi:uncharacterized protein
MQLQMSAWAPLLNTDDINYGLLLPIFAHCVDDQGHPLLGPTRKGPEGKAFLRKAYMDIPAVVEPCASTGCRPAIDGTRDYDPRGSSYRLR